ncbi:MAG TPA: outer membrane protein assembly factor BamA [Bacteroidia bacterium]|nr:outer membrane protein assembly factor BamA [Bacteroidia bacterium]HNT79263.1 outer membrane protein assembly factor BamA [Bacteroidia bacterium]
MNLNFILKLLLSVGIILLTHISSYAQVIGINEDSLTIDYASPKEYEIGGISVEGIDHLDKNVLIAVGGLRVGDKIKIPSDEISDAIKSLWKQGLLSDIKIYVSKVQGNLVFLEYQLKEMPRLTRFSFNGITKGEADKLREKLNLVAGRVITQDVIQTSENRILAYFTDKGLLNASVSIDQKEDTITPNGNSLVFNIKKGSRVKIANIIIHNNEVLSDKQIKRKLKETKEARWYRIFSTSKYLASNFEEDKEKVLARYLQEGNRDAAIVWDTIYQVSQKRANIEMRVKEGNTFYFRNISWVGNTKFSSKQLNAILGINSGDIYNQKQLDEALFMSASGRDISSLYMDDGYLFFQIDPVEVKIDQDSVDLEIRIYEGRQARINKVIVNGNTKTNDHVIMREVKTMPGELFSRTDVIRTQRELAQLGFFDQEKLGVNPKPNPADGTVDLEYTVEERPSDQFELSGGWGAGRLVGSVGVSFNNFSAKNIFNTKYWDPLPSGDGQRLSLRATSSGPTFSSINASFTEPWLGGKKPNSFSFSVYSSTQSNGLKKDNPLRESINITGVSVGLGKRVRWPDDFFSLYYQASYQYYVMRNFASTFIFSDGFANNIHLAFTLSRNSIDAPIYPRRGSEVSLGIQATPPYSLFSNKDYSTLAAQEKYKFIEYHKWSFKYAWYNNLMGKFVLHTKAAFSVLGFYDQSLGYSPFERYYLGGDGLSGFSLDGREIIALRGYSNLSITPRGGGTVYDKFTMELRYPVSLNPSATIYVYGFLEAGNNWTSIDKFQPYNVYRSTGLGFRIFLPMFGLLGLDWGYGLDNVPSNPGASGPQFHFSIGQQF